MYENKNSENFEYDCNDPENECADPVWKCIFSCDCEKLFFSRTLLANLRICVCYFFLFSCLAQPVADGTPITSISGS